VPRVAAVSAPVVATVGDGATVTVVVPKFDKPVSFAVIVTEFEGAAPGAVNVAATPLAVCAVIVPQLPPPHVSAQSKPWLPESLLTLAVIEMLWFTSSARAELGLRPTMIGGGGGELVPHPLRKHKPQIEIRSNRYFFITPPEDRIYYA
jgi:hypothetical protein